MARRKLILHGALKKLAPEGLELEADTVMEAVNGMCRVLGIQSDPIAGKMAIKVVGFDSVEKIVGSSAQVELHIVPAFYGAGLLESVVKIVVGAVLIVAGLYLTAIGQPLAGAFLFNLGATLVIGGLINLLFPIKTADNGPNYLGAPGNTTAIGTRISLLFGTVQVYGQVLSYNIDSVITDPIVTS